MFIMNRPELYNKTVDILVQAYMNDTLQHANCHACAVGNLIAANMGIGYSKSKYETTMWNREFPVWIDVHCMKADGQHLNFCNYTGEAKEQIDATGYSPYETAGIELAFESNRDNGSTADERMFNSLLAVIEYLDKIHENKDATITEQSKKKFHDYRVSREPAAL